MENTNLETKTYYETDQLIVTSSPHVFSKSTTTKIMLDVLIALMPATIAAVIIFGLQALWLVIACVASSVLFEFLFQLLCKKPITIKDLSAAVTGLLLALNLPATVPVWQAVIGSIVAVVVVKGLFGGIGHNFANPAITARIIMLIAFAETVTSFANPVIADVTSSATPLASLNSGATPEGITLMDMLLGLRGGAIGETCSIALLLGFVYLLVRRVISWHTPVVYIGTVFVLMLLITKNVEVALYQCMAGGLLIGAIFMATDYSTSPQRPWGKVIFALGCALITVAIRKWGNYPEGVSFSILFMNILTPYINKLVHKRPFGGAK